MDSKNSHIEKYLQTYYQLPVPPSYAVLLKGAWGSGKTWFVKRSIERVEQAGGRALYVSLYGIASTAGIERELFRQLHPVLGSKAMTVASKALFGALRGALKIEDLTLSMATPDINLPEYLTKLEGALLVFDDVERCAIPIEELLGYLNHFVEHGGHKLVLVANEDEIIRREEASPSEWASYGRIKEKLIGKTFQVEPDVEEAIGVFGGELASARVRTVLKANESLIRELYDASQYRNLRHLRQSFFDFERLFGALPDQAADKPDLARQLLGLHLIFSFEVKSGLIRASDILGIRESYFTSMMTANEDNDDGNIYDRLSTKYVGFDVANQPLEDRIWVECFECGVPNADAVAASVLSSGYFEQENTPAWKRLWHALDLTDEDLREQLEIVVGQWERRELQDAGVVLHVAGMLLWLEEIGVYTGASRDGIVQQAKRLLTAASLVEPTTFGGGAAGKVQFDTGWDGLGFGSADTIEFKELRRFATEQAERVRLEKIPEEAQALLATMEKDAARFCRMIIHNNHTDNQYYDTPILKYIAHSDFVASYQRAEPAGQRLVCSAIKARYQFQAFRTVLAEEAEWLYAVGQLLRDRAATCRGTMSSYRLTMASDAFDEARASLVATQ